MEVRLTVVGCSPAWPNPGGAQSGYLVESSGAVLLDCGPGVLPRLRQRGSWPEVDAIVITHWHLDHWGDLVPWTWGAMLGPGRATRRPELWLPPGGSKRLRDFGERLGWEEMFETVFDFHEYSDGDSFEVGGLEILPVRVPHYTLLTFALRVSDGDTSIAYSGDSGPSARLVEVAHGADLFVCEATLERAEYDGAPRGHLSADEAIAAFREAGAARLLITHRPAELPAVDGYELATDGLVIEL